MKTNQNAYCVVFLKNTKTNLYISILCDSSSSGIPFCLRYSFRRTERWYLSPGECFTLNTKRISKYCSCPCGEYSGVVIVICLLHKMLSQTSENRESETPYHSLELGDTETLVFCGSETCA